MICKEKFIMIIILILNCKSCSAKLLVYYKNKYYVLNLWFISILLMSFGKIKIKEFLWFKMYNNSYKNILSMKLSINYYKTYSNYVHKI